MRTKRVNRYYCDFCKKSGGSGGHIRKHERGCTRNANRECGVCRKVAFKQQPTSALLAALEAGGVDAVKKLANGCPACVMAAIHALRAKEPLVLTIEDGYENFIHFDYRTEAKTFWAEHAEEEYAY